MSNAEDGSKDTIQIVTSADSGFLRQLVTLLRSIEVSNAGDLPDVTVLTDADTARSTRLMPSQLTVNWVQVPDNLTDDVVMPSFLESSSLWRVSLDTLVASELDRVIYLDADMVVRHRLRPLWEFDLESAVIGAVRDPLVPWFGAPKGPPWRDLDVDPASPYFNAGMMLIDVSSWRRDEVSNKTIEVLRKAPLPYADQCALNTVLIDRWAQLPPTFNVQGAHLMPGLGFGPVIESADALKQALADPAIVHFNTSNFGRPWLAGCTHPFRDEWYATLDETEFAHWRPRPAPLPDRVFRRVKRAASTLITGT